MCTHKVPHSCMCITYSTKNTNCIQQEMWSMQTFNGNLVLTYPGNLHDHLCKFEVIIELYRKLL